MNNDHVRGAPEEGYLNDQETILEMVGCVEQALNLLCARVGADPEGADEPETEWMDFADRLLAKVMRIDLSFEQPSKSTI